MRYRVDTRGITALDGTSEFTASLARHGEIAVAFFVPAFGDFDLGAVSANDQKDNKECSSIARVLER